MVPAVEAHGPRRIDDGEVRRHRGGARGVPRAVPLEGLAGHDAERRAVLQAQDGRVPGDLAHARPRRRGRVRQGRARELAANHSPGCLWHAFSQENRHTTSRPRLRAGMLRGLDGVGAWFEGGRIWFCGAEKLGICFIRKVTAFKRRITNKDSVILYHMEKTQQTHCTSCCVLRWFNSMRLEQT